MWFDAAGISFLFFLFQDKECFPILLRLVLEARPSVSVDALLSPRAFKLSLDHDAVLELDLEGVSSKPLEKNSL